LIVGRLCQTPRRFIETPYSDGGCEICVHPCPSVANLAPCES
jgi:hypothetical protein